MFAADRKSLLLISTVALLCGSSFTFNAAHAQDRYVGGGMYERAGTGSVYAPHPIKTVTPVVRTPASTIATTVRTTVGAVRISQMVPQSPPRICRRSICR